MSELTKLMEQVQEISHYQANLFKNQVEDRQNLKNISEIVSRAIELLGKVITVQTRMEIQIVQNKYQCINNTCEPATHSQETQTN